MQCRIKQTLKSLDPQSYPRSRIRRGFGIRFSGFGTQVSGFDFRVSVFRFPLLAFGFPFSGFGFEIRDSDFSFSGCGLGIPSQVDQSVSGFGVRALTSKPNKHIDK